MRVDTDWIHEGRLLLFDIMGLMLEGGKVCHEFEDLIGWTLILDRIKQGDITISKRSTPWSSRGNTVNPVAHWGGMSDAWLDIENNLLHNGAITKSEGLVLWYVRTKAWELINLFSKSGVNEVTIEFYSSAQSTSNMNNPVRSNDDISSFRKIPWRTSRTNP